MMRAAPAGGTCASPGTTSPEFSGFSGAAAGSEAVVGARPEGRTLDRMPAQRRQRRNKQECSANRGPGAVRKQAPRDQRLHHRKGDDIDAVGKIAVARAISKIR